MKKKGQSLEEHELFSAMPPLEALKMLCSLMTLKAFEIKIIGISRAHSYGKSRRPVYTNLPPGREQPGKCAKLLKTMYGIQDASSCLVGNLQ